MDKFLLEEFFDLSDFAHQELFEGCDFAWEPLSQLEPFFNETNLGVIECPIPEGVHLIHPELISIGKGSVIEPGASIKGPCIIGPGCEVRHGAYIRGFVLCGSGCVIGHATEIKFSILLNGVSAGHFNYVGDSILGNQVNLGAGVKLANLRLDSGEVQVADGMKRVPTGLRKLGALVGDGAQMGCNGVANPGTLIGKGAFCHPLVTVSGYAPPGSKVRSTQKTVVQDYVDRSYF